VVPVPDELLGSRLRAAISAGNLGGLSHKEELDRCRRLLPAYMVPDLVEFCEVLHKISSGKIDRALLASKVSKTIREVAAKWKLW